MKAILLSALIVTISAGLALPDELTEIEERYKILIEREKLLALELKLAGEEQKVANARKEISQALLDGKT